MKNLNFLMTENSILTSKEANSIIGGNTCGCACRYADSGGSSIADNSSANEAGNLISKGYRLQDCKEITVGDYKW